MDQGDLAAAVIGRFVADNQLDTEALDDGGTLFAVMRAHGAWGCTLTPVADGIIIESIAPLTVPVIKHRIVAELLGLLNVDLALGALVLDTDTGEVVARSAVALGPLVRLVDDPVVVGAALLGPAVKCNLDAMNRWLPAVTVVLHSPTVPADAVAAIRARDEADGSTGSPSP